MIRKIVTVGLLYADAGYLMKGKTYLWYFYELRIIRRAYYRAEITVFKRTLDNILKFSFWDLKTEYHPQLTFVSSLVYITDLNKGERGIGQYTDFFSFC